MTSPNTTGSIEHLKADDPQAQTARAQEALTQVGETKAEDVICMMSIVITRDPTKEEPDRCATRVHILGGDYDIAKMIMTLATITRNSVIQANTPSNPNNETAH